MKNQYQYQYQYQYRVTMFSPSTMLILPIDPKSKSPIQSIKKEQRQFFVQFKFSPKPDQRIKQTTSESTNVTIGGTRGRESTASRNRRSLNFRFRSTPPIFGHRPPIWVRGRRSMGRLAVSKCYYQNCQGTHPTSR